jgi:hypothetical protein
LLNKIIEVLSIKYKLINKIMIIMKTLNISPNKRCYLSPVIERIQLDNEISLALASNPAAPDSGDEVYNAPSYFNNDPFKTNVG